MSLIREKLAYFLRVPKRKTGLARQGAKQTVTEVPPQRHLRALMHNTIGTNFKNMTLKLNMQQAARLISYVVRTLNSPAPAIASGMIENCLYTETVVWYSSVLFTTALAIFNDYLVPIKNSFRFH